MKKFNSRKKINSRLRAVFFTAVAVALIFGTGAGHAAGSGGGAGSSAASVQQSREATVTGTVTDAGGKPIIGVTILLKNQNKGTTTGVDGSYTMKVPVSDSTALEYKFLGYTSQTILVGQKTRIDVVLREEAISMSDVIVTGYGNIAKEAYTGSATVIGAEKIGDRAIASFEDALRGVSVGTLVTSTGQPGEENVIRLRGVGSMNADNQPLYVIDGVVWDQVNMSGNDNSTTNPLNTLNPSDIANMTILKDAASASLYGSRGANGVIVITTKGGKLDSKVNVSVNMQAGFAVMSRQPDLVNGREYANLWVEGKMNTDIFTYLSSPPAGSEPFPEGVGPDYLGMVTILKSLYGDKSGYYFQGKNFYMWQKSAQQDFNALFQMPMGEGYFKNYDYFGDDYYKLPSTDWFKQISRVAPFVKTNISLSGGSKNMAYYTSLEYFNQQGTIINSQLERFAMRMKLSSDDKSKLINWGVNSYVSHSLQSGPQTGGEAYNTPQYAAVNLPSVVPPFLENGQYNIYFPDNLLNSTHNPVASAYRNVNDKPSLNFTMTGYVQLNLLKWLNFRHTTSIYFLEAKRTTYYDMTFGTGLISDGQLTKRDASRTKIVNRDMFFLNKKAGKYHNFDLTAGVESEDLDYDYNQTTISNFASNGKKNLSNGSVISGVSGGGYGYSLFSVVTKLDYNFRSRYYLSGSYRMDQSSRFAEEYRTGHFWSVSGAYTISNEPFWKKKLGKAINRMKLKGSYGVNGTLPTNYYQFRDTYTPSNYMNNSGAYSSQNYTYDLSWESNRIWNVGIEARFWKSRINLSVEYYDRKSKDLLQDVPVSLTSGFNYKLMNTSAGIHNNGVEVDITATLINHKDWSLDVNFNIAYLKSVYYGLPEDMLDSRNRQLLANGKSVYTWYLRESVGIDKATGYTLYSNCTKEGCENYGKTCTTGSHSPYRSDYQGIPKYTGGFTGTLRYKEWTLSALFSFAWGHYIYDRLGSSLISNDGAGRGAISRDQLDRWTPDHTNATAPLRQYGVSITTRSTRFLVKGDYLKLKNLSLRYGVPQKFSDKLKLSSASVFIQSENLGIWSKMKDYDPEMSLEGYRNSDAYPTSITTTVGLTLNF